MMKRLDYLQDRLRNLDAFLKEEDDKQSLYANDVREEIKKVKAEIKQLKFAKEHKYVMVDEDIQT